MTPLRGRVALAAAVLVLASSAPAAPAAASPARASAPVPAAPVASACPAPGGVAVPRAASSGPGVVVQGRGWGHGLGMSQYGAQGAARLGCSHAEILAAYYPGTRRAQRVTTAPVELALAEGARRSTVAAEGSVTWTSGGRSVRQPAGTTWILTSTSGGTTVSTTDGAAVLVAPAGAVVELGHAGTAVRVRSFATASSGTAVVDLRLRWGTLTFTPGTAGASVREVIRSDGAAKAVERYLWGLAEVPVSWPQEALRAQVVAARTYLARSYVSRVGRHVIGVTAAQQVYGGARHEDDDTRRGGAWRAAVNATRDQVLVDSAGAPIWALYSSSHGGRAESRAYVYGSQGGFDYLVGLDDSRWDAASENPRRSWAAAFTPAAFASRLGFTSVSSVSLAALGSPARGQGLVVTGRRGSGVVTERFTGDRLRAALGLLSPVIEVSWAPDGGAPASGGATAPGAATTFSSSACTATACTEATGRFSGSRTLTGLRLTVQDRTCNGRRAFVRLLVRHTDGTSELTPVRYAAARCTPPATTFTGLSWADSRPISGVAVVAGEAGGPSTTGRTAPAPRP